MDTIFALATAQGKAGIAVIRVSGPDASKACMLVTGSAPKGRRPKLHGFRDADGLILDQGLVLFFEQGASFTGEDVVEFHCHGSTSVVSALLRRLSEINGLRLAEPGEFTRRALENGRLNLSQVEGLADLIDSETELQRRQALKVFQGALGSQADAWRGQLIRAAALLEATIDFADEEVPEDVSPEVIALLEKVLEGLKTQVSGSSAAERIRSGFEVAILGAPNAGKSALLNALAGRDAAITSTIAGTTRDVIEVRMDLDGLPVTVLDTAGLREAQDEIERIGIDRALHRAEDSDLRVFLVDDLETWTLPVQPQDDDIIVLSKADLRPEVVGGVSGLTGQGVRDLTSQITTRLTRRTQGASLAVRERHRVAMSEAVQALNSALDALHARQDEAELIAEDIRIGVRRLEAIIGRVDVESLLGEIFASFCLGK